MEQLLKSSKKSAQSILPDFPIELFWKYSQKLEIYHGLFTKLWQLGKPRFVDTIPTACVCFDKKGDCIDFQFNYEFWNGLDEDNRLFIICHELLHVVLSHGKRLKGLNKQIGNIAADVVINEMLVAGFGFTKSLIKDYKEYCWFETVFKNEQVPHDKSFEYYYNKLYDKAEKINIKVQIVEGSGGHDGLESLEDGMGDKLSDLLDGLSDQEKKEVKDAIADELKDFIEKEGEMKKSGQEAGSVAGNISRILNLPKIVKKRKWETIIHNWARKHIYLSENPKDQFVKKNRRFHGVNNDLLMPSEMDVEDIDKEKRRINLLFVLDTSGSTCHLAERFFKAALSIPNDRFKVDIACFDTRIYPLSKEEVKKRVVKGFGGTDYNCVVSYFNNLTIKPDAIFTITDGYFSNIYGLQPKDNHKFYWFLTEGGSKHYIPKDSKIFELSKFE